jgi:hypothetical protein
MAVVKKRTFISYFWIVNSLTIVLVSIFLISVHFINDLIAIESFTNLLIYASSTTESVKGTQGVSLNFSITTVLNYLGKLCLVLIGMFVGLDSLYNRKPIRYRTAILSGTLFIGVLLSIVIPRLPLNRLIALFLIATAVLVGTGISNTVDSDDNILRRTLLIALAISVILPVFSVYPLDYWTGTDPTDSSNFGQSDDIQMAQRVSATQWSNNIPTEDRLYTSQSIKAMTFYYGDRQWSKLVGPQEFAGKWPPEDQVVLIDESANPSNTRNIIFDSGDIYYHSK